MALIPDASCRKHRLVDAIEEEIKTHLRLNNLQWQQENKKQASILAQYVLLVRRKEGQVAVQLDVHVFDRIEGKLLVKNTSLSDFHLDDGQGMRTAATQSARRLAQNISDPLNSALTSKGKTRKVMLQIIMEADTDLVPDMVFQRLKARLSEPSIWQKGQTQRNLMAIVRTSKVSKELVDSIEMALATMQGCKIKWVFQSDSSLILRLEKKPR